MFAGYVPTHHQCLLDNVFSGEGGELFLSFDAFACSAGFEQRCREYVLGFVIAEEWVMWKIAVERYIQCALIFCYGLNDLIE